MQRPKELTLPPSFPSIESNLPDINELEISIFGPGVGECLVVHLGDGEWMIIDSCLDPTSKQPVALQYLEELGVDPSTAVKLILVSHWHDDHIKGLSVIVERCEEARVCYSAALLKQEFLSVVSSYSGRLSLVDRYTSGTREIAKIINLFEERVGTSTTYKTSCMVPVTADRGLFDNTQQGGTCQVKALSPSDKSFTDALVSYAELIPDTKDERVTLVNQKIQNHSAIVVWVTFNNVSLLLGSDLEETGDQQTGWSAILNSPVRPSGRANIFKVPHHGSPNGHHETVWGEMVEEDSTCLLTSYSKGKTSRPQPEDIKRIKEYTSNLFFTANSKSRPVKRDSTVERTLRGMVIDRKVLSGQVGHVQIRAFDSSDLKVNLKNPAVKL